MTVYKTKEAFIHAVEWSPGVLPYYVTTKVRLLRREIYGKVVLLYSAQEAEVKIGDFIILSEEGKPTAVKRRAEFMAHWVKVT